MASTWTSGLRWTVLAAGIAVAALAPARPATAQVRATSARSEATEVTRRADELLAQRRPRRAARLYRRAIDIDDSNVRARLGLCAALVELGELEPALASLRQAEAAAGWTPQIGLARGVALARFGRADAAAAAFERVLASGGDGGAEAAFELGQLELARSRWQPAVAAFDRALADRAQLPAARVRKARVRRALALLRLGRNGAAERDLRQVVRAERRNVSARVLLVSALARQGRCRPALAELPRLAAIQDRVPTVLYDVALCRHRIGDRAGALAALDAYATRRPLPVAAVVLAARIHASLGDRARAVGLLWPLVERGSRDAAVLRESAIVLRDSGDVEKAATASERLIAVADRDAGAWALHAEIALARGRAEVAQTAFERALALRPGDRRAGAGLGRALAPLATAAMRAGDAARARELLIRAHRADPAADDLACNLALLELERGDPARAIELVSPHLESAEAGDRARLVLARAYMSRGEIAPAREQLTIVAESANAARELRLRALLDLSRLAAPDDPDRAKAFADSARRFRDKADPPTIVEAITAVEFDVRISQAERDVARGQLRPVAAAMGGVVGSGLPPDRAARVRLLKVIGAGHELGLAAAVQRLGEIADAELDAVAATTLPRSALRHVLPLYFGAWFLRRPADHDRLLRAHASALHDQPAVAALVTAWYDQLLARAIANRWTALARRIARATPAALQSPSFRHNSVVAQAGASLTAAQRRTLEQVAGEIPEAAVNLAADAERAGDHAAALARLRAIPAGQRSRDIAEWIRWKERFHGAP